MAFYTKVDDVLVYTFSPDWKTFELYPLCDLHIGDPKTDEKAFFEFVKFILSEENRYITIQGDLMNNAIKSSVSNVYNENRNPHEQKKWLVHHLLPLKDRILCYVPGNHEGRSTKDADVHLIYDIAESIGGQDYALSKYKENGAFIKIRFGLITHGLKTATYTGFICHGSGGGAKAGGYLNKLEDYAYSIDGIDFMIAGHTHKKFGSKPSKMVVDAQNNMVTERDFLVTSSGAWQTYGGYAMRGLMRPGTRGKTPIIFSGTEKEFHAII